MKKLNLFYSAIIAIAFIFASCNKEVDSTSLTLDNNKEATLIAYIYAPLDINEEKLSPAPEGTLVTIKADYSDFNDGASGIWTDTLKVDSEGKISTNLKVSSNGVTYTIAPVDFEYDQVQVEGADISSIRKLYSVASSTVQLFANDYKIQEYKYTANEFDNDNGEHVETITVNLYINGYFDQSVSEFKDYLPVNNITIVDIYETWSVDVSDFNTASIEENEDVNDPTYQTKYSVASVRVKTGRYLKIEDFTYAITLADSTKEDHIYKADLKQFDTYDDGKSFKVTLLNSKDGGPIEL